MLAIHSGHHGEDSLLRRWGLGLAARGGPSAKRKAIVAVARKLAVLMHALWRQDVDFEPFYGGESASGRRALRNAARFGARFGARSRRKESWRPGKRRGHWRILADRYEQRIPFPSAGRIPDRSSPSRVRFAALRAPWTAPGRSEAQH